MRSIRLSLLVYFLALLFLSLGVVSGLVYRIAQENLADKNESLRLLIVQNDKDDRRDAAERVDKGLFSDARNFYHQALEELHRQPPDVRLTALPPLGLLTALPSPGGHVTAACWAAEIVNPTHRPKLPVGPLATEVSRGALRQGVYAALRGMVIPGEADSEAAEYYQIELRGGYQVRSPSLGRSALPADFLQPHEKGWEWDLDTFEFRPGVPVRRGILKAWVAAPSTLEDYWQRGQGSTPAPQKGSPRGGGAPPLRRGNAVFIPVLVQVATAKLHTRLAALDRTKAEALARLEANSTATLQQLRWQLLTISSVTFLATVLGVFLLVQVGLLPVRRLSRAVSEVSEKDFRLPLDGAHLPAELRPIADRLNETLDSLKRAFAREKQAAADISHELRTPLAAMMTTLDVALRKTRSAEEYHEVLEECRHSGQQMTQLVERMLALARLDAGSDHLRPVDVDVNKLAEQCAALVRPLAAARDLALAVHHNGPAVIKADPDKLREVVTNLLHNAVEYNRPGGRIDLRVGEHDGRLEIEVADTGIGIAPAAREHIFERFYREDPSRDANTLHAGIGLALVKGYVDLMGGTIALESTVGAGSTFRIGLPKPGHETAGKRGDE